MNVYSKLPFDVRTEENTTTNISSKPTVHEHLIRSVEVKLTSSCFYSEVVYMAIGFNHLIGRREQQLT